MPIVGCKICTNKFYIKPSHQKLGWGKYCSIKCRSKSQFNGKNIKCFVCKRVIYRSVTGLKRSKSKKYFCSKSCQTKWRNSVFIEDKSLKWKNGIRVYRNLMERRNLLNYCSICGIDDKRILIIHHIDRNRSNNAVENLKCLCHNCHYIEHHYT